MQFCVCILAGAQRRLRFSRLREKCPRARARAERASKGAGEGDEEDGEEEKKLSRPLRRDIRNWRDAP